MEKHISEKIPSNIDDFVRYRYIAVTLRGMAHKRISAGLTYARNYAKHSSFEIQESALLVIEQLGDETDIDLLLGLLSNQKSVFARQIARTAIAISTKKNEIAIRLLTSVAPEAVSEAIALLAKDNATDHSEYIEPLLLHSEYMVRRDAFIYFKNLGSTEKLEQLLDRCISHSGYNYDVVCWIDRHLYAPS